ncbi:phage integrase N-terminal SAM-like domain-containing protein [Spirochaeta cellobiosiphila]|uniref:phage integrase N-terminal SAM-like domain-containing protein n=1 Tax=Spirochaeta cellobiosiphila TaxID=504483 RepID=UPI003CCC342E
MKRELRLQHKSYATEKTYLHWLDSFLKYFSDYPEDDFSENALKDDLTYLVLKKSVSFSTQRQAFRCNIWRRFTVKRMLSSTCKGFGF